MKHYLHPLPGGAELMVLPMARDNYGYLLRRGDTVVLVDPTEAGPCRRALAAWGRELPDAVWLTHGDHDHLAGLEPLLGPRQVPVFAHPDVRLARPGRTVDAGDTITVGDLEARVIHTPGHTLADLVFHLPAHGVALVGDLLFTCGCGRVRLGTMAQMFDSLCRLATLPPDTLLCGGHEYAEDNCAFAASVLPGDAGVEQGSQRVAALRGRGRPTMPTRLADELAQNLFLRCHEPALATALDLPPGTDPAAVFAELRGRKDRF